SQENRDAASVEELRTRVEKLTEQLAAVKTESRRRARNRECYMCGRPSHRKTQCPRKRLPVHTKTLEYSSFLGGSRLAHRHKLPYKPLSSLQLKVCCHFEEYTSRFVVPIRSYCEMDVQRSMLVRRIHAHNFDPISGKTVRLCICTVISAVNSENCGLTVVALVS
ncbi:hypothetical protein T265_15697, partial [Opisthorchis viverrini]